MIPIDDNHPFIVWVKTLLQLLSESKRQHLNESGEGMCAVELGRGPCDCGAAEYNARVDAAMTFDGMFGKAAGFNVEEID